MTMAYRGTKSLSIDEHDIVANETNHNGMHNDDGVAANGGDKIMIAHASTDMHDTDQTSTNGIVVQNNSRGPSRSQSSFHQQARVAMMAAGIESPE